MVRTGCVCLTAAQGAPAIRQWPEQQPCCTPARQKPYVLLPACLSACLSHLIVEVDVSWAVNGVDQERLAGAALKQQAHGHSLDGNASRLVTNSVHEGGVSLLLLLLLLLLVPCGAVRSSRVQCRGVGGQQTYACRPIAV
jgi:hypothetical protein